MNILKLFIFIFLVSSCGNITKETSSTSSIEEKQQFVIKYPTDTINYLDVNGHKQGLWIDLNTKERLIYKNDTAYNFTDSTVQELIRSLNKK